MKRDTLKHYRNWAMGLSAGVALLGLALILWPETSALTVCWLLGVLCVALGVCQIARYCRLGAAGVLFRFDLGGGILGVLAGLLLLPGGLRRVRDCHRSPSFMGSRAGRSARQRLCVV